MKKILLLLLAFASIQLGAQCTDYSCPFTGTSNVPLTTSCLLLDHAGNKWIGFDQNPNVSTLRLVKFDNTNWTDYSAQLGSVKVSCLAEDAANVIWIGTATGLVKFDGTNFTTYTTGNSSIAGDNILSLHARGNKLYIGTNRGFSVYDGSTWQNFSRANSGLSSDSVYCFNTESATQVWIGTRFGLDVYDNNSTILHKGIEAKVNCIYVDPAGLKWLGVPTGMRTYNNTVFSNPDTLYNTVAAIDKSLLSISGGPSGGVSVYTQGGGLYELLPGGNYKAYQALCSNSTAGQQRFICYSATENKYYVAYRVNNHYPNILSSIIPTELSAVVPTKGIQFKAEYLAVNKVKALILNNADMHWDLSNHRYEVPKGSGSHATFASSFWMGGYHNNQLHMGAMTYRQTGADFWPGPLDTVTATADSMVYINTSKVKRFDIENFRYNFQQGNVQNGSFPIHPSIANWPATSANPKHSKKLAPYVDYNQDGLYNPAHGDYPDIKGDEMVWWVFNDNLEAHSETTGLPMGIEVHASAYAYTCPSTADSDKVINYTTYYHYEIFNRSNNDYDSCHIGLWMDADLGNYNDDYIGSNVCHNYGYIYNGDNYDEDNGGATGYHDKPPVFACQVLNGPLAEPGDGIDNNNNGVTDEAGEVNLMHSLISYRNYGSLQDGNPTTAGGGIQQYNLIRGHWLDGSPLTYGASGTAAAGMPCLFAYPGTSDPTNIGTNGLTPPFAGWSELNNNGAGGINQKGDRKLIPGCGPFHLGAKASTTFDFALVFTQDDNCTGDNVCPLTRAEQDNIRVKKWFDAHNEPSCLDLSTLGVKNQSKKPDIKIYPNPAHNMLTIELPADLANSKLQISIVDVMGQTVKQQEISTGEVRIAVPVSTLSPGVYFVKVYNAEQQLVAKLLKE